MCCPTDTAVKNLAKEGVNIAGNELLGHEARVIKTGDVMQDAAMYYSKFSAEKSQIIDSLGVRDSVFCLCIEQIIQMIPQGWGRFFQH